MSSNKKSFLLHIDSLDVLDDLTNEQAGLLFKAIKFYQNNEELELDSMVKIAFSPFRNQFARDDEKYQNTCKRRAEAGSKGGKQKVANASKCKQKIANVADSDSKNKTKSDSDKHIRAKRFAPPTHDEAFNYFSEKGLPDPNESSKFIDFYEMKGWMVGKNKMKDWKAAIRNWIKNAKPVQQPADNWDDDNWHKDLGM